ncbi:MULTISPECIES: hypothetical protein [unclassified Dyella]|uniref:hypothetical protein n=1 Tax=unclassified Dyella TaxID=2634549 RepID=UPI003F915749
MKHWFCLIVASVLLASCSWRPLSEVECQQMTDKEIEYAVARAPAAEAESLREHLLGNADAGLKRCMKGATYRRSDYRCMMRANEPERVGKCISVVSERMLH